MGHSLSMETSRGARAWTLIGAVVLAASVGVLARRSSSPRPADELRDAIAAPISPAMLGGARVAPSGYFSQPSGRRAEAERALLASRLTKVSKAMHARAAKLRREAARERALAVSAQ